MRMSGLSYGFLITFLSVLSTLRFVDPASVPSGIFFGLGALFGVCVIAGIVLQKRTTVLLTIAAGVLGCMTALFSAGRAVHVSTPGDIESFAGKTPITLHGWIVESPDVRPTVTKLTVAVDRVEDDSGVHAAEGRIVWSGPMLWPPLHLGDEVLVRGVLQRPEKIDTFDYPHYLELSGIRGLVHRGSVRKVVEGSAPPSFARTWKIERVLSGFRTAVEDKIGMILPEPHASLLAGLLTGTRRGLPDHVTDDFRRSGITHVIAVSGFNVTIVLTLIGGLLFWIPLKKRLLPLACAAVAFCVFVGAGAPVVRATIMGLIGLLALAAGRTTTVRLSILWTAFIMTVAHPLTLWYDASFQLSFLAVFGLSELSKPLQKLLRHVPQTLAIRESLTATIAAQIATIPLSILLFGQFSLIAPVTNVLVAPLIPPAMLLGTVSILLGWIWLPLGLITGYVTWALLELILIAAHLCAMVPLASITF